MRFTTCTVLLLVALVAGIDNIAAAKKAPRSASSRRGGSSGRSSRRPSSTSKRPPVSKRRAELYEEDEDDYDDVGFEDPIDDEEEDYEDAIDEEESEEEEEEYRPRRKPPGSKSRRAPPRKPAPRRSSRYEDEEDYPPPRRSSSSNTNRRPPPGRGGPGRGGRRSGRGGGGRVVPYTNRRQQPSTFTRGLTAIRKSMPDPGSVKEAAMKSLSVARETTSGLSANLYREVKGLTSSELEQVMLKATRPDDTPVKGKHAERLVGVTYQISGRYDIYDAVLRKLWAKMAEKDWRTTIKALYILHRFAADGSPEHAPALKARVRELRRTRDPKRKGKFFSSKLLLAGDNSEDTAKYRAFMGRYAHYVLLRAQCFGGMFDEFAAQPAKDGKKKKVAPKPITSTSLKADHLDAAKLLLETGTACVLKNGEECENTALAVERVASDLLGLTTAVTGALTRALKDDDLNGADPVLIKKWCEFYSEELLPQTRSMVKRTAPKLDAFGLFLPSRMGPTLSQDLLQKGLKLDEASAAAGESEEGDAAKKEISSEEENEAENAEEDAAPEGDAPAEEEEANEDELDDEDDIDEYEYDEDEEYYDDEDDL
mmetsp:Transcript_26261/g.72116  ORF Transcript_26261/g.72116 Transcript_26261/m.72116 type:complete len:597 (+) Transcript_26261:43-1833(+)|eukprot:CAMPEP_0172358758 /NCGR_PEP_ID=MMETSP1060-20121228/3043_1 /TAXON_ID=37318 /ORGANISM="Pseudo-nitzschia pungens, Strain cf. cingulata" /LENGTH=596 /DNA_ID=CAMNT_0013080107 /DNA_START=279 /DNA_END=2069 /DNA_ORIENTATION=-